MSNELLYLKLAALIVIFISGMLGGQMAHLLRPERPKSSLFFLSEAFVAGIFLGVGLIHALPDAISRFHSVTPAADYPLAALLCAAGFLLLFILDRISQCCKDHERSVYLLLALLSVHAVIAGAALGLEGQFFTAIVLFFAIVLHKLSSGYVLGVNLRQAVLPNKTVNWCLVGFSLMSPIGLVIGWLFLTSVNVHVSQLGEGIFDALVAGTFLYLAMHNAFVKQVRVQVRALESTLMLILGVALMALLAL